MVAYLHDTETYDSERCKYPSKPCFNTRARKLNGEPHKLCEGHRRQANRNQKRLQERRRMEKFHDMQMYVLDTFTPHASEPIEDSERELLPTACTTPASDAPLPDDAFRDAHPEDARTDSFWGYFENDVHGDSSWCRSLGTLSPLRIDDDDQLRVFTPDDLYILYALLLEP